MRRSGIGSGSHRSHISRIDDENPRGTGAAAGGRNIKDYGNRRVRDFFDDLARGVEQSSGSTDFDQNCLVISELGFIDRARDEFRGDGLDRVVENDFENFSGRRRRQQDRHRDALQNPQNRDFRHSLEIRETKSRNRRAPPPTEYSYSYLRTSICELLFSTAAEACGSRADGSEGGGTALQPGRSVLPVISRAPRSYVTYDQAH